MYENISFSGYPFTLLMIVSTQKVLWSQAKLAFILCMSFESDIAISFPFQDYFKKLTFFEEVLRHFLWLSLSFTWNFGPALVVLLREVSCPELFYWITCSFSVVGKQPFFFGIPCLFGLILRSFNVFLFLINYHSFIHLVFYTNLRTLLL